MTVDLHLFDRVDLLVRAVSPDELGTVRTKCHRYGIKVWFNTNEAPRAHYEAQVLGRHHVDGTKGVALEIGFHCEHRDEADNESELVRLLAHEKQWRSILGDEAIAGPFLGKDSWRRLSDTWLDPDLSPPDIADEIAYRLIDYTTCLEPILRADD